MTFLKRSGQRWKFNLFQVLLLLGGVSLFIGSGLMRETPGYVFLLVLGGILLSFRAMVYASLAIRCNSCDVKLFWMAISKARHDAWFMWITTIERCPVCRSDGSKPGVSSPNILEQKFRSLLFELGQA